MHRRGAHVLLKNSPKVFVSVTAISKHTKHGDVVDLANNSDFRSKGASKAFKWSSRRYESEEWSLEESMDAHREDTVSMQSELVTLRREARQAQCRLR